MASDSASHMVSDMVTLFGGPEWGYSSHHNSALKRPDADYFAFSLPNLRATDVGYLYISDVDHREQDKPTVPRRSNTTDQKSPTKTSYVASDQKESLDQASAPLHFAPPAMYQMQSGFTALNTQTTSAQDTKTIEPNRIRFDSSFGSSPRHFGDGAIHSASSSSVDPWSDVQDSADASSHRRRESVVAHIEPVSSGPSKLTARRRKSEIAEPGSTRAVYLEKNRKAASKCRGKQKKQQEELVDNAREIERRNRSLKIEVDLLRAEMRELMEVVGKHTHCPDNRLRKYVQREADRLAAGEAEGSPTKRPSLTQSPSLCAS